MARTVYEQYLEAEILSADPMKLVWLLNRGAMDAVHAACRHIEQGDIGGRSREINRAWSILQELAGSLDHSHGGEISRRLAGLYAYMQSRLIDANVTQSAGPLREVEGLLAPLLEGWRDAHAASQIVESKPEGAFETAPLALA
jgi:flagellar protein FliS